MNHRLASSLSERHQTVSRGTVVASLIFVDKVDTALRNELKRGRLSL